ncbi:arylesterase [Gynuella sunshinyii]|uniref:Lysophospholipase L1 and related esterase n=1 Tax=Gynuella sunshinyii YC6258 TaxID=1445510 RepID=A0A0C5VZY1_9GAMM|nr:arylesterase [Gynuella sunshinyii]AJQ95989.1 lysophospholipase L1 and related esterase [Gynuella sunshinyii YC6258]
MVLMLTTSATLSAKTILVLGDSISAAYGIPADAGWVTLLQQKLQQQGFDDQVINASFGGATSESGVQRLPGLLKQYQPDILLLELGGNDGLQGKPVPYITQNLRTMISTAQASQVQVVLLGIKIPPNYGSRYTEPFFQQYENLANEYKLVYVPFILAGIAENPALMQNDGIHPVAEAQSMIVQNIWPVLMPLLK